MLHHLVDKKILCLFRHLLDKLSEYELPNGNLLDYGVACFTMQAAGGSNSFAQLSAASASSRLM